MNNSFQPNLNPSIFLFPPNPILFLRQYVFVFCVFFSQIVFVKFKFHCIIHSQSLNGITFITTSNSNTAWLSIPYFPWYFMLHDICGLTCTFYALPSLSFASDSSGMSFLFFFYLFYQDAPLPSNQITFNSHWFLLSSQTT